MPVLSRLRLGSIGCPAARFDPLDLELVGADLRLRHTLLWLRNGGGKSSLISLILLLLNPKVGSTLGKTTKGEPKLETDYVLRGETGVVLAEWLPDHPADHPAGHPDGQDPTAGPGAGERRRHVTFMAMQRGEREGKADKGWVGATLPLDVDPAEVFELHQLQRLSERGPERGPERRGHSVEALVRRARELQRAHPAWEVVVVANHEPGRWVEHLRGLGIDPGLATLLTRMNVEEGDLAKALTFGSAEEFVTQAARLLAPPEETVRDHQRAILAWSIEHRAQAHRRLAREELLRVRPAWEALVEKGRARAAAREALREQAFEALALLEGVSAASPMVAERQAAAEAALVAAEAALEEAAAARERLEGEAAAAARSQAAARCEEARQGEAAARARAEETAREQSLARATVPAVQLAGAELRLQALQAQRAARRTEAAPRFRRRDALALALAARSEEEAVRAHSARDTARAELTRAREEARAAQTRVDALGVELARAEAELEGLRRRLLRAQSALAALKKDGLLLPLECGDEELHLARARAEATRDAAEEAVAQAQAALAETRSAHDRAEAEAKAQATRLGQLATERRQQGVLLTAAREACAALALKIEAAQVGGTLHLGRPELPAQGEQVLEVLRAAHRETVVRHAEERSRLAGLEATCESLRARDLLPAPTDVRRVSEAAGLSPALDYLRANLGDRTGEALRAVPGLAHGAIAPSAAALGRAREALERLELEVDAPVPVFLAAELTPEALARATEGGLAPRAVVGLAPHTSAEARSELLTRRTAERERVRRHELELRDRVAALELLLAEASEVLARDGATAQAELQARLETLDQAIRATAEAQATAQRQAEQARSELAERGARLRDAQGTHKRSVESAQRLSREEAAHAETLSNGPARVAALESAVAELTRERTAVTAARDGARGSEEAARDRETAAEQERMRAEDRARRFRLLVEDPHTPAATLEDPPREEAELEALHRELVAGEAAVEAEHLRLQQEAERHRRRLRELARSDELRRLARERAPGLSEAEALAEEQAAIEAARQAAAAAAVAETQHQAGLKRLEQEERRLSALQGLAREAAAAWSRPDDPQALESFLAAVPTLRRAAEASHTGALQAVSEVARARDAALALVKTWAGLVEEAREAWEVARGEAPEFEAGLRAAVRADRNARVILDPAAQAARLAQEARACAKAVGARRAALSQAESEWSSAAGVVIVTAESSQAEAVRRFATVRLPVCEGTAEEQERARRRAVAERGPADLELLDREVEDIDAQLADVARTLTTVSGQLADLVTRLGARVRELQRASVLPDGLGAWSGQTFLTVDLPLLEPAQLGGALERQLVAWADRDAVPSPRELIPQALNAGLAGAPSVAMPKADRFDRWPRRRPIAQLGKDSGGEALTAAFILFCVLARVVAGGPSRRDRRVTLALIDNPFGTANRFDFVEAQCVVAAAFGVQYLAATGINDPAVSERFERLITLSNPSQHRVEVTRNDEPGLGRAVDAVLWAREAVLLPAGGVPRAWPEAPR